MNIALEKATETEKTEKITRKESKETGSVREISSSSIHLEAEDTIEDIVESGKVNTISIDYFCKGTSRGSSGKRRSTPSQLTAKTTELSRYGKQKTSRKKSY